MAVKITCIKKANGDHENPYVAIKSLKWIEDGTGKIDISTREQMYDFVTGGGKAYVKDEAENIALLEGKKTLNGTRYVKTVADDVKSDNLLKLPECN